MKENYSTEVNLHNLFNESIMNLNNYIDGGQEGLHLPGCTCEDQRTTFNVSLNKVVSRDQTQSTTLGNQHKDPLSNRVR